MCAGVCLVISPYSRHFRCKCVGCECLELASRPLYCVWGFEMGLRGVLRLGDIRDAFAQTYATIFSPLTFFIWAISIVLATTAGPFGSYEAMHWPVRLTYWSLIVTIGIVF